MSIFREFPNQKVYVRFNSEKAGSVTLFGREQIEAFKALRDGHVYEAIAYPDQFGGIKSIKLRNFPKVFLSARMFDFS